MKHGKYAITIYRRKGQKRLSVRKEAKHHLIVFAPYRMRKDELLGLLDKNRIQIDNLPARFDYKSLLEKPSVLTLFGKDFPVIYQKGNAHVTFDGQTIKVTHSTLKTNATAGLIQAFLKDRLRTEAESYHHALMNKHKQFYPLPNQIKSRYMHTRFGSCNPQKKTINLNLALIHYPKRFLKSVYLHELVHFEHQNHSKRYYQQLSRFNPNYKTDKRDLEIYHRAFQK